MKRLFGILLICAVMACSLAGCADPEKNGKVDEPQQPAATLSGKIVECTAGDVMLAAPEGGLYRIARTGALAELDDSSLAPGSVLTIGFSGLVLESYPAQIKDIETAELTQGDDLVGLYLQVVEEMWAVDPALNDGAEYLAFDLSKADNLTAGEKEALAWMAAGRHDATPLSGTIDELAGQGYIKDSYFEKGLLFRFTVTESAQNGFQFQADKWRSGLAAIFYSGCTAQRSSEGWRYELGDFAIS